MIDTLPENDKRSIILPHFALGLDFRIDAKLEKRKLLLLTRDLSWSKETGSIAVKVGESVGIPLNFFPLLSAGSLISI